MVCTKMLYVGYPISYESACELFKTDDYEDLKARIEKVGLGFHSTDKGQNILGFALDDFFCSCEAFVKVDDAFMKILKAKKKVKEILKDARIDITSVPLCRFWHDEIPEFINDAEPYLITE